MNLFDVKNPAIEKFRKRGAIPHQFTQGERCDLVYIRADGWSLGGPVEDLKARENGADDWHLVWQRGDNGGDVVAYDKYIRDRDGVQAGKGKKSNAKSSTLNDKQDNASSAKDRAYKREEGLFNKGG